MKHEIRKFHTVVEQWRSGKEIYKKGVFQCKFGLLLIEPFSFFAFLVAASPSSDLKFEREKLPKKIVYYIETVPEIN